MKNRKASRIERHGSKERRRVCVARPPAPAASARPRRFGVHALACPAEPAPRKFSLIESIKPTPCSHLCPKPAITGQVKTYLTNLGSGAGRQIAGLSRRSGAQTRASDLYRPVYSSNNSNNHFLNFFTISKIPMLLIFPLSMHRVDASREGGSTASPSLARFPMTVDCRFWTVDLDPPEEFPQIVRIALHFQRMPGVISFARFIVRSKIKRTNYARGKYH